MTHRTESGTPKVTEMKKREQWQWLRWNNLPHPVFFPIKNLKKQNGNPFGEK
ncbi:MAG TPA: hypothetical protein VGT05_02820 [Patescibacteria group bacterium]|nr:hypothetical protein [Patescibacteria group bacterium]